MPIRGCLNITEENSEYCIDHQHLNNYDGGMTFGVEGSISDYPDFMIEKMKRMGFPLEEMSKYPPGQRNDMVDANVWALRALRESMKKTVRRPEFIYSFLFFFLGFGVGLFAAYMVFLFTLMN
ncbi:hypothetical protein LCGC14_1921630 [marine sediment metagenome]|uniref:Uncharacterized protein n=1 Tax=marine sediment metagenome TaxID=412755 RepID=A0A0F9FRH2_9ZZZZ